MRARVRLALVAALVSSTCSSTDDPASYVTGLRVLAIKAEPPEVPSGATSTLTALAVDTEGAPITLAWASCLDPPPQGDAINPACVTATTASYLNPVGSGLSVTTTMPSVAVTSLGRPDATGGVYVPYIVHATAGTDALIASYLLRVNLGTPPNHNPTLSGLFLVPDGVDASTGAGLVPLDDASPPVVHAGDEITLRVTFAAGSAETYAIPDPTSTAPHVVTETLSAAWFSTAGDFSTATSGADVPDVIFHLDQVRHGPTVHLPTSGAIIDLWVVGRDERGGADYLHRSLQFE